MENIRDWCISRQLWWGHQIPVWYCDSLRRDDRAAARRRDAGAVRPVRQQRPAPGRGHARYVVLVRAVALLDARLAGRHRGPAPLLPDDGDGDGYEIIFFWVARMIMMGLFCMDDLRDGVDEAHPVQVRLPARPGPRRARREDEQDEAATSSIRSTLVDTYGADALRFSLITGGGTGQDQRLREEKVEAGRNFANKLWNAARFVIMQLDGVDDVRARRRLPSARRCRSRTAGSSRGSTR